MAPPCVVPLCNSNYRNRPKHKVYSFPMDKEIRQKWINAIHREDFEPTKYSKARKCVTVSYYFKCYIFIYYF